MAASLKVQVEVEKPGIVEVRAVARGNALNDARPVAGFFVRRRYHGQTFMLARWEEFSSVWMEFTDPASVPKEWLENIKKRSQSQAEYLESVQREESKPLALRMVEQMFSMVSLQSQQASTQGINMATGQVANLDKGKQK